MADRAQDPRSAPPIRWGILGAGNIAATFASAVNAHTRAQLVAVGSRNRDRAQRFAWLLAPGKASIAARERRPVIRIESRQLCSDASRVRIDITPG